MKTYKFDNVPDGQHAEGYAVIEIAGGLAEIDEADAGQMALAEKLGGQPAPKKSKAKPAPKVKSGLKKDGDK